ncbi:O-antigen ligase family protein [Geodermatophilus sp. SYSU D00708]
MDAAYLIYVAYCFISAIWSVTPADTLTQAAFALIGWLATLAIRAMSKAQLINLVVRATFIVATLSFAAIILLPGMAFQPAPSGDLPELRGIYDHQLRLGLLMGIVVGIMLIARLNGDLWGSLRTTRPRLILIFVVILVCFIAALARLNSFFIVLALALTFGLMRKSVLRLASLVAIAAASLLLIFDWNSLLRYAGDRGVDLTLTGRTNVWATTQALSEKAGLFGYGLGSFTDPSFDAYWQYYRAPSAHNSFLQANFETGVVGLTLLAVLVVTHLATSYSAGRTSGKVSYSFFLVLAVALCSITAVVYAGKPTAVFELMLLFLAVERQDATSLGTVSARRVCTSAREPAIP